MDVNWPSWFRTLRFDGRLLKLSGGVKPGVTPGRFLRFERMCLVSPRPRGCEPSAMGGGCFVERRDHHTQTTGNERFRGAFQRHILNDDADPDLALLAGWKVVLEALFAHRENRLPYKSVWCFGIVERCWTTKADWKYWISALLGIVETECPPLSCFGSWPMLPSDPWRVNISVP